MKTVFYKIFYDPNDNDYYAELFYKDGGDFSPDMVIAKSPTKCQDKTLAVIMEAGCKPIFLGCENIDIPF